MPKTAVSDWSTTAASNTDLNSINIDEGCAPSGMNNAMREMMAQLKTSLASVTYGSTGFARVGTNIAPTYQIDGYVTGSSTASVVARNDTVSAAVQAVSTTQANVGTLTNHPVVFISNNTEQARLLETGELVINGTAVINGSTAPLQVTRSAGAPMIVQRTTSEGSLIFFDYAASTVGSVSVAAAGTTYNVTSDYRRKPVQQELTGFWGRIKAVIPRRFQWDFGAWANGFVAHEFAEVYPGSVQGEKDAVDEDGKPIYQSMQASTSEVMADIMAALKDIDARLKALETTP
jgi:hypothetical protein